MPSILVLIFPSFIFGQFTVDQCIDSITVHCDTCEGLGIYGPGRLDRLVPWFLMKGGFIERENRNVFEVGFIREYCEGFGYRTGSNLTTSWRQRAIGHVMRWKMNLQSYEIEENDELFSSVEQMRPLYTKSAQSGFEIGVENSVSDWLEILERHPVDIN